MKQQLREEQDTFIEMLIRYGRKIEGGTSPYLEGGFHSRDEARQALEILQDKAVTEAYNNGVVDYAKAHKETLEALKPTNGRKTE